jgi:glycosyltransferase involved in cell wall biosynthesis
MKQQFVEAMPTLSKNIKIEVIPNPFVYTKRQQGLSIPKITSNYIVSAGRLIPEKGFDILIKAFAKITHNFPDLKLLILGEGKERESLSNLIESLSLKNKVILYGHVKDVFIFFKNANLCVVSSRIEGFPNVLLQMMSQNTKVISTLCAGDVENIDGIKTIPTEDISAMATAISYLLVSDCDANREIFDKELQKRNVESFVQRVNYHLNAQT